MDENVLDLPKAVELVLKAIELKGADFRHQDDPIRAQARNLRDTVNGCVNIFIDANDRPIAPGCLVGTVVHLAGWELGKFITHKMTCNDSTDLVRNTINDGLFSHSTVVADAYLRMVQSSQDDGYTWGNAHAYALDHVLVCETSRMTESELKWLGARETSDAVSN